MPASTRRRPVREDRSGAIRIDVVALAVHRDPLGLHFVLLEVAVAMAVRGHLRADGEHAVFYAGGRRPRRRRERERPLVAFGVLDHHGRGRPGEAHRFADSPADFEFFVEVTAPTVMRQRALRQQQCDRSNRDKHQLLHATLLTFSLAAGPHPRRYRPVPNSLTGFPASPCWPTSNPL